jgi:hypothetical protein
VVSSTSNKKFVSISLDKLLDLYQHFGGQGRIGRNNLLVRPDVAVQRGLGVRPALNNQRL